MDYLTSFAESRIAEAVARGELDDLPGQGKPLTLDDDRHVPPELRMAWRVLKNAGFLPPGVEARRDIASLEKMLAIATDEEERARASRRLLALRLQLESLRGHEVNLQAEGAYGSRLAARLNRGGAG